MIARLAHRAWVALNRGRDRRFRRALRNPKRTQDDLLRGYLRRNADTAVGRRYGFDRIDSIEAFRRRVPIRSYDDMADDVERLVAGDPAVLTREPVTRLVPSSGSTAARKLIPFTRRSQEEFQRAVGPWIVDLHRRRSRALAGRAYWSVSPKAASTAERDSAVPIGFDDDAAYLGGVAARLVDLVMAVPSSVSLHEDLDDFRFATLRHLLAARDLSMISVWHPTFLTLLLDALPEHWDRLLEDSPTRRADELRRLDPADISSCVHEIWPKLDVVSCWRDAHAAHPARDLESRLPGVAVEAKGLLATEAVVTLPYAGRHPLAIRSHVFEFLDDHGTAHPAADLHDGAEYNVVVTTGGGLYRYRLGDRVRVRGFLDRTPCLEFLGRDDRGSDLRGEKLSEGFVAAVLARLLAPISEHVHFAMLAPETGQEQQTEPFYRLFLETRADPPRDVAGRLDQELRDNPHYRLARDLGQLGPADVVRVEPGAHERYLEAKRAAGQRLGDVKPAVLEVTSGWMGRLASN